MALWEFEWNFRYVIFKWILVTDGWGISFEIALLWMSLDIVGANVDPDLCSHMASLGKNELILNKNIRIPRSMTKLHR